MNYFTFKQDDVVQTDEDGRRVLAVDIQPEKACIFDCVVCTRGRTKYQGEWHDFGPAEDSLASLRAKIAQDKPDIVELYGQGDILANIHLGEIIDCIHAHGLPVRLITNCYLLGIDGHMEVASKCEEVVGAFGIIDEKGFRKYHRPLPELGFTAEKQTASIVRFSQQYQGKFKLRVFFSKGFNDSDEQIEQLRAIIARIRYDSLWVVPTKKLGVSPERMEEIRAALGL